MLANGMPIVVFCLISSCIYAQAFSFHFLNPSSEDENTDKTFPSVAGIGENDLQPEGLEQDYSQKRNIEWGSDDEKEDSDVHEAESKSSEEDEKVEERKNDFSVWDILNRPNDEEIKMKLEAEINSENVNSKIEEKSESEGNRDGENSNLKVEQIPVENPSNVTAENTSQTVFCSANISVDSTKENNPGSGQLELEGRQVLENSSTPDNGSSNSAQPANNIQPDLLGANTNQSVADSSAKDLSTDNTNGSNDENSNTSGTANGPFPSEKNSQSTEPNNNSSNLANPFGEIQSESFINSSSSGSVQEKANNTEPNGPDNIETDILGANTNQSLIADVNAKTIFTDNSNGSNGENSNASDTVNGPFPTENKNGQPTEPNNSSNLANPFEGIKSESVINSSNLEFTTSQNQSNPSTSVINATDFFKKDPVQPEGNVVDSFVFNVSTINETSGEKNNNILEFKDGSAKLSPIKDIDSVAVAKNDSEANPQTNSSENNRSTLNVSSGQNAEKPNNSEQENYNGKEGNIETNVNRKRRSIVADRSTNEPIAEERRRRDSSNDLEQFQEDNSDFIFNSLMF